MKSRRKFITEPGDRRWLETSQWTAAAGGLVVVLLFGAMALLHPGERAAVDVDRAAQSFVTDAPAADSQPAAVAGPASSMPSTATDADVLAAPDNHPPTF